MIFDVTFEEQNNNFDVDFDESIKITPPNKDLSQNILYTFSYENLSKTKMDNGLPIMDINVKKTTIINKGGVSCNIPAINIFIRLWTGERDLSTNEITPYFEIPIDYTVNDNTLDPSSIRNVFMFKPLLKIPLIREGAFTVEYLLDNLFKDFATDSYYLLGANSFADGKKKTIGFSLKITFEVTNTEIQEQFVNEGAPIFYGLSHLCLLYQGAEEVECEYIGG